MVRPLIFLVLWPILSWPAGALAEIVGSAEVLDGDTLVVAGQRVRLWGIDAPEVFQRCRRNDETWRCGMWSTTALVYLVHRKTVRCEPRPARVRRGVVAVCFVEGVDLSAEMVRLGWALAYRRHGDDYADEEAEARAARAGLWAGKFLPPWEWRRRRREGAPTNP